MFGSSRNAIIRLVIVSVSYTHLDVYKRQVVGPVKTQFGYHLIKVEDKKEAGESSLEEVKDQIRAELSQKKQEEAYRAKVDELKKKYME